MPAEFLRKLVGRAPPAPEVAEALEHLKKLAANDETLAGPANLLREVLAGLYAKPIDIAALPLTREQTLGKWEQGIPLLRGEKVAVDAAAFARRWKHTCKCLQRQQTDSGAAALADALRRGLLDAQQLLDETLSGNVDAIHARAEALQLDAALMATVLRLTLFPFLSQLNSATEPWLAERKWDQGYCPTCGSWPLLGEFRGLEQTRYLRCGLCAAGWEFPRLRCPFCNANDHRQLGYFYVEAEEGKYRAATCEACRGYVKMSSSLSAFSPAQLLVVDVATMHLDLAAAERGYEPILDLCHL